MKTAEKQKPMRYNAAETARLLNVSVSTLWRYSMNGTLTPTYPFGKGRGKATFYDAREVEMYALGLFDELKDYQREKRKARKTRKR